MKPFMAEFEHPVEAVQAISMFHNQTYYDRKMSVRMDRVTEKHESVTTKLPPGLKSVGMGLGVNGSALTDVASKWWCDCLQLGHLIFSLKTSVTFPPTWNLCPVSCHFTPVLPSSDLLFICLPTEQGHSPGIKTLLMCVYWCCSFWIIFFKCKPFSFFILIIIAWRGCWGSPQKVH